MQNSNNQNIHQSRICAPEFDKNLALNFLQKNKIDNPRIEKIAGDASFRSYYRVFFEQKALILMYAPVGFENPIPFIKVDEFLIANNFSAPKILAFDEKNGFLLLEDFGDNTFSRILSKDNLQELSLYKKACDVLVELHKISSPKIAIPLYNHAVLFEEVMLFIDWYLKLNQKKIDLSQRAVFKYFWFEMFDMLDRENQVVVLRDYHADNLMIVDSRLILDNFQSVGLLDFQDALIGSKAYDLVSLLEDARRDLQVNNRDKLFDYFVLKAECNSSSFIRDYEILSLQRNIKILGIFARLSLRDKKDQYLKLLPRVLGFVSSRLENSQLINPEFSKLIKSLL